MTSVDMNDFVALILTNRRPDKVKTYNTLRKCGYTGEIRLVVDDEDPTIDAYVEKFGKEVVVFSKKEVASTFDVQDNQKELRGVVYARNASFELAKKEGFKYFIQLDDDYTFFSWRFDSTCRYNASGPSVRSLDLVFYHLVNYLEQTQIASIALAQGGDYIGGASSKYAQSVKLTRKCMNSFICSVERPFKFLGRINEDVNIYVNGGRTGLLMFTTNQVSLAQMTTQANSGGLTEIYLDAGTYVKSFYTVMLQPSSVKVRLMGESERRLHHSIDWRRTVPKIVSAQHKKTR